MCYNLLRQNIVHIRVTKSFFLKKYVLYFFLILFYYLSFSEISNAHIAIRRHLVKRRYILPIYKNVNLFISYGQINFKHS